MCPRNGIGLTVPEVPFLITHGMSVALHVLIVCAARALLTVTPCITVVDLQILTGAFAQYVNTSRTKHTLQCSQWSGTATWADHQSHPEVSCRTIVFSVLIEVSFTDGSGRALLFTAPITELISMSIAKPHWQALNLTNCAESSLYISK